MGRAAQLRMIEPDDPAAALTLNGVEAWCEPGGALWLPDWDALIVSDLHFEKASHFAEAGYFVPPYDTGRTLDALEAMVARRAPSLVVSLGDAFHDPRGPGRMALPDRVRLEALMRDRDWVWVTGNHDPEPLEWPGGSFDGEAVDELRLGALRLVHEPTEGAAPGEVAGHLHPVARIGRGRRSVRRPCFACDGLRIVLPAIGAFTGGLNVCDRAFAPLFDRSRLVAHMLGEGRVYSVSGAALCG